MSGGTVTPHTRKSSSPLRGLATPRPARPGPDPQVLIAPARVGNAFPVRPRWQLDASSSPLRGLATGTARVSQAVRGRSSSPLRGLATPRRARSRRDSPRSSSPLRGLATANASRPRLVSPSSPHRPCEGWQRSCEAVPWKTGICPHRPCEGWQLVRALGAPVLDQRSSSPLRGLATRAVPTGPCRAPRRPHRPCEGWQLSQPPLDQLRRAGPHRPCEGWQPDRPAHRLPVGRRSSSPLRGLATPSPRAQSRQPTRPHRPCEGWQLGPHRAVGLLRLVLIAPARVGNGPRRRSMLATVDVLIAPARVGNMTGLLTNSLLRQGPHRPCEGWQRLGEAATAAAAAGPHRPCEGWQRPERVTSRAGLRRPHRPCEGWQPALLEAADDEVERSSSPLRGLATTASAPAPSGTRSTLALRGLATPRLRPRPRSSPHCPYRPCEG